MVQDDGTVVSGGCGGDGRLGHGDEEDQLLPKVIAALQGKRVVQISAGNGLSLVLMEDGEVFSFGFGCGGLLGHGDDEGQLLPKVVAALQGKRAVQISAGHGHSLVLMEGGGVFSFGR